jgi:transposase InsO family protein
MTAAYHNAPPAPTSSHCSLLRPSQDDTSAPIVPGYVSASELAAAQLPGLPKTHSAILRRAAAEGWRYIDRAGRGGGRLFHLIDLPKEAREALAESRIRNMPAAPVGRPKGSDYFTLNPDVAGAVEALIASRRLSAPQVMKLIATQFVNLPSKRSLQRFMAKVEDEKRALIASIRDPDAYKGRYRVALGRADADTTRAHQCWELDTTKADVMTAGGRKMILGVIDRWSRRANFMVVPSESGQAVRRFLVDTIRKWGVMPEAVMTDNGSGFINQSIRSALDTLGIEHRICPPGSPEKKPHVERLFGTFNRECAELLSGYIGHSVAEAQALRAKARKETGRAVIVPTMTPEELQTVLDGWVDGVYHVREHSSLRMSPMRKWQSSPARPRAAVGEDVLRLALSALVGQRNVGKRGVQWKGGRYWSAALAPWVGRDVIVRRDEDDLGQLFIFAPSGEFIDIAVSALRSGLSEAEFAMAAHQDQDSFMRSAKADMRRRSKGFTFEKARDRILRDNAEAVGKLIHFAPQTQPHSTPTIASLTDAANTAAPVPAAAKRPAAASIIPLPKSPAQKVREADEIIARADAGELVDADELRRAQLYATTSEYRAQRMVADAFAAPAQSTSA